MANTRNGNGFYIDTQSSGVTTTDTSNLVGSFKVKAVIYRTSNATNQLVLKDVTTGAVKLNVSLPTSLDTEVWNLQAPLVFPNGIAPTTLTAATATLIIE